MSRRYRLGLFTAGLLALLTASSISAFSAETAPGFFRYPDVYGDWVVFTSEGDLWKAPLKGGVAIRLTTGYGEERFAHFSNDGSMIAYSGQEDGHDDVYVVSSQGGQPRRLTYHPERDQVLGWDKGGNILFRSMRDFPHYGYKVYSIPTTGGYPASYGLYKAAHISLDPKSDQIAFTEVGLEFRTWKRYQGGWAEDIFVGDLKKLTFKKVSESESFKDWQGNYGFPMWHTDGRIYFLSDKSGRGNIWSMKPDGSDPKQHTKHADFDVRFPEIGGNSIVYQNGMDIWALNLTDGKWAKIDITLPTDREQARIQFVNEKRWISDFQLTPDAKRLIVCARGELFTLPTKKDGLVRRLTWSSGVREKFPIVSRDGLNIAAWSDATGEELLYLYPITGGEPKKIGGDGRNWHFPAIWSPDGKSLLFSNEECELILMDAANGKTEKFDDADWEIRDYVWSPDSRFIAYSAAQPNYNSILKIYDTQAKKAYAITDDFSNNSNPVFSTDGKYLFFMGDRVSNPRLDGAEMSYILDERTLPYAVSLKKGTPSLFAAEIDPAGGDDEEGPPWMKKDKKEDEKKKEGKKKDDKEEKEEKPEPVKVEIDFEGIGDRIAPFPVGAGNYGGFAAVEGKVFYAKWQRGGMLDGYYDDDEDDRGFTLMKFDLKKKKADVVMEGVGSYDISYDGKKLVIRKGEEFIVQGVDEGDFGGFGKGMQGPPKEENDKVVDFSQMDLRVDRRAEWKQMFLEAWRLQRDFFWDPNLHKVDWNAIRDRYRPLADRISTRDELNDLIGEIFGELNCSHTYVGGGDQRRPEWRSTGLLGVDVTKEASGFYRIDRVIVGRPWMKGWSSPLAAPGIDAKKGEYIVAINGQPTNSVPNYLELLLDRAGKVTTVSLNSKPSLEGAREVAIKPLGSERDLRHYDWVDGRRSYVTEKSGGKIGYIHLSDMGGDGLSQFAMSYLPQHQKQGLVMDVRYNGGGFVAEMILSHLERGLFSMGMARHGLKYRHPQTAFHGHMAAVSNGETGSDGETFTEGFRRLGLGPIIGTRTWGGWVGIRSDKPLLDGGMVTQPEFTGWGIEKGEWMIEGWGTEPDYVIEDDQASMIQGKDPSLDYTIKYLMDKIAKEPKVIPPMPPYPDDRGHKKQR